MKLSKGPKVLPLCNPRSEVFANPWYDGMHLYASCSAATLRIAPDMAAEDQEKVIPRAAFKLAQDSEGELRIKTDGTIVVRSSDDETATFSGIQSLLPGSHDAVREDFQSAQDLPVEGPKLRINAKLLAKLAAGLRTPVVELTFDVNDPNRPILVEPIDTAESRESSSGPVNGSGILFQWRPEQEGNGLAESNLPSDETE